MAKREHLALYEKLLHDADFYQQFRQTLFSSSKQSQEEGIVHFLKSHGYELSAAELQSLIQRTLDRDSNGRADPQIQSAPKPTRYQSTDNTVLPTKTANGLDRFFIWLSGASADILASCPESEHNKQAALGGAVLIPALLAIVTASFLLNTLNFRPYVIAPVALMWSCMILLMDRAILATYRKGKSIWGKIAQFSLRFLIAFIIALSVSHPVVLLLFSERIDAAYNEGRIKNERNILAQQCDLKNPNSELRLLDSKISEQRLELKSPHQLFEPQACSADRLQAQGSEAPNLAQLKQDIANLRTQQAQADQDVLLFTENAEKEKKGTLSKGLTGVQGCLKGSQCKHWLSQASARKDDSIRIGKAIADLERNIVDLNEKMANQLLAGKQAAQAKCDKEREELKALRAKQYALDQKNFELLNNQRDRLSIRCSEKDAVIDHLKPDVLTQTELLTQLILPNHKIAWHNLLIFLVFMLLFLAIDLLAVVLKMTNSGIYEDKVEMAEKQNKLLASISNRREVFLQLSSLIDNEKALKHFLNHEEE